MPSLTLPPIWVLMACFLGCMALTVPYWAVRSLDDWNTKALSKSKIHAMGRGKSAGAEVEASGGSGDLDPDATKFKMNRYRRLRHLPDRMDCACRAVLLSRIVPTAISFDMASPIRSAASRMSRSSM